MGGKARYKSNWILLKDEKSTSFRKFVTGKGMYQRGYLEKIIAFLKSDNVKHRRTAIDVGASYGFVTDQLSSIFDEVKCFEIVDPIRECLKSNVINRDLNNVEIFDCGLSDTEKTVDVYFNPRFTGHSSVHRNPDINSNDNTLSCKVKTLDSFAFENVDFIKMDVEGEELNVLRGAINTIQTHRPIISTEHNHESPEAIKRSYEIVILFESLDYEFVRSIAGDLIWFPKEKSYVL